MRFILRNHTAATHAALDAQVGGFSTLEEYRHYLRCLRDFRAPVEQALRRLTPPVSLGGWSLQPIGAAIDADLADLGTPPETAPAAADLQPSDAAGWWLGTLYVLEGSSIGARLLLRRAEALGLTADHGARHLALQAGDKDAWPRFMALLDAAQPDDLEPAKTAASDTFALALRAFADQTT